MGSYILEVASKKRAKEATLTKPIL